MVAYCLQSPRETRSTLLSRGVDDLHRPTDVDGPVGIFEAVPGEDTDDSSTRRHPPARLALIKPATDAASRLAKDASVAASAL